jgi:predicted GNAT family N-acyltransferase
MHFPILLRRFVSDSRLRLVIGKNVSRLAAEEPVFESTERFQFTDKSVSGRASLFKELKHILDSETVQCVTVLSDKLTTSTVQKGLVPSDLAKTIRQRFLETKHLCGLVALAPGASRRILDIDRFADSNVFNLQALRTAIVTTANGLRLKAPPNRENALAENDAIKITAVQSEQQLEQCLQLRFRIYGLMGYLPDEISSENPFEIEMDSFDLNSIHFVALTHNSKEVVGTTRVVLPQVSRHERTLIGNPKVTIDKHRNWCKSIATKRGTDALRDRVQEPYFMPLPILQSNDFCERWRERLDEATRGGEISRVVVSPKYRGLGISKLLMRAAIATAYSIGKEFLLLECIPRHAEMYQKCGFSLMEGSHNRVQELDQVAVAMRLRLDDRPDNYAVQMARRDIISVVKAGTSDDSMLSGAKYLCLCRNRHCWSQAAYDFHGKACCPLRAKQGRCADCEKCWSLCRNLGVIVGEQ